MQPGVLEKRRQDFFRIFFVHADDLSPKPGTNLWEVFPIQA
jgi:hypothetical protein